MRIVGFFRIIATCSVALSASAAGQSIPWKTPIRFVTDSGVIDGRIESADSTSFRYRVNDEYRTIRRSAVSSVLRRTTLAGKGARMGAIGGGVAGGIMIGGLAGAMCESDGCGGDAVLGAIVGGAAGALGGAAIGGLIGSSFTRWTRLPARFEVRYDPRGAR